MTDTESPFVFLPGSGGGVPDLSKLRANASDPTYFEKIDYPGWQRYVAGDFSAEVLIEELSAKIEAAVPRGPIRIMGLSMGGHFGYAAALHLQSMGREVAGFCAIDAFMIDTAEPTAGWQRRALAEGLELLRKGRGSEVIQFARSKLWRALLRLGGARVPQLINRFSKGNSRSVPAVDPILERELSMRLLVREVAPWLASLDDEPVVLNVPAILLRTKLCSVDDQAWRRRCPNIEIYDIPGLHHTLFEPENIGVLRDAFVTGTSAWCKTA